MNLVLNIFLQILAFDIFTFFRTSMPKKYRTWFPPLALSCESFLRAGRKNSAHQKPSEKMAEPSTDRYIEYSYILPYMPLLY